MRQQPAILGDVADASPERDGVQRGRVRAVHQDATRVGLDQPVEAAQERCLPRAALADHAEALSAPHLERDGVEGDDRAEALHDPLGGERAHQRARPAEGAFISCNLRERSSGASGAPGRGRGQWAVR